jgi:hypothetical protein
MSLSKSDLTDWRDTILTEMQRITKAPGSVTTGAVGLDNERRMALLTEQLAAVNRLLALYDGPRAMKLDGIDA